MAKRGQGEGTISKRTDGTWWARITIGKDENGKQKRKAFYGKTRKDVQEKLTAALNDIKQETYTDSKNITIAKWCDIWLKEYKKKSVKPKTYMYLECCVRLYIKPKLGHYKLKELKNVMVQALVNDMHDQDLSLSYIRHTRTTLRGALAQAIENGLLMKNVAVNIQLPAEESEKKMRILTVDEQKRFIEIAKNMYHGRVLVFLLGTGLRIGEALALKWDDVDFESANLQVNKTQIDVKDPDDPESKFNIQYASPKTKTSVREVPLLPEIINLLEQIQEEQVEMKSAFGQAYSKEGLIFGSRQGERIFSNTVRKSLAKINKEMGLEGFTAHGCRHTFATRCFERGVELRVVQEMLGHADINITARIYTHVQDEKKKDAMTKLEGMIEL